MYSPRLRWRRSVRSLKLARATSRSLRQATYSGEPTAKFLARQVASSSVEVSTMVGWPRSRQPASSGASSASARRGLAELDRMYKVRRRLSFVIAGLDPAIHRNQGSARHSGASEARARNPFLRTACGPVDSGLVPSGAPRNDELHPALQRIADFVEH